MKKILGLSHRVYLSLGRQKPVPKLSVKIPFTFNSNVNNFPLFCNFNRKFSLSSIFKISSSINRQQSIDLKDKKTGPTDKNLVIYYGGLTSQIKGVKIFTCTSSIGGLVIQPILIQNLMSGTDVPLTLALGTTVGFFTFVTPFLIHLLTKKYITEMRYNAETDVYTATTLSFFLRKINVEFTVNDVKIPSDQPFFTTLFVKGKPVFMTSDSFLVVDHYIRLMGYDKPMDLKLSAPFEKLEENQIGKNKSVASHGQ